MYLLVTSLYDYDDGWKLLSLIKMSDKEAALKYKEERERDDSDICVEVYEANRID